MDLGLILGDAIKYPLSDWKKILILGILTMIGSVGVTILFIGTFIGIKNVLVTIIVFIVGYFLVGFLVDGYNFRIIKNSMEGNPELPDFKRWIEMFVDGVKVYLVFIFYSLPAILIFIYTALSLYPLVHGLTLNPSSINVDIILSVLSGLILVLIALSYMAIILPLNYMAVAHMAKNNSQFSAAFRFHEIIDEIGRIGWGNLIVWYLVIGTIYILISIVGSILSSIFSVVIPFIGIFVTSLIITPYLHMYLNRSIALVYMSN
jgi:hypothetical protein